MVKIWIPPLTKCGFHGYFVSEGVPILAVLSMSKVGQNIYGIHGYFVNGDILLAILSTLKVEYLWILCHKVSPWLVRMSYCVSVVVHVAIL